MAVELVFEWELMRYRFPATHPLRPERFSLSVELIEEWGLVTPRSGARVAEETPADASAAGVPVDATPAGVLVDASAATDDDLLLAHDSEYVAAVKRAGADPSAWRGGFGIGPGDTPAFEGMHEASALVCGSTLRALRDVLSGSCERAFSPAGGLHHAHRGYASGFCVYNDLVVAIARALLEDPGLRVAYVDVDAHHGDGVQAAFFDRAGVLTVSTHESGRYLFPGTGRISETGSGNGAGFAVNLPLPPSADDACYALVFERVIAPAVREYTPDVIVAQLGADSHRDDPLAHLMTTVAGQHATARRIVGLADEVCGGRLTATGGGGYDTFSAVPRAWACDFAALLGVEPPAELPEVWREQALAAATSAHVQTQIPECTFEELAIGSESPGAGAMISAAEALDETEREIDLLVSTHPLFTRGG